MKDKNNQFDDKNDKPFVRISTPKTKAELKSIQLIAYLACSAISYSISYN